MASWASLLWWLMVQGIFYFGFGQLVASLLPSSCCEVTSHYSFEYRVYSLWCLCCDAAKPVGGSSSVAEPFGGSSSGQQDKADRTRDCRAALRLRVLDPGQQPSRLWAGRAPASARQPVPMLSSPCSADTTWCGFDALLQKNQIPLA